MTAPSVRGATRLAVATGVALGLAVALAGCGGTGITAPRLDSAVATAFGNLWSFQQVEEGHSRPVIGALGTRAACLKGTPAESQQGAGNDWVCDVTWLVDGPTTPVTAIYNLNVKTDGCYTADGDGPASVNGQRTITTASGGSTTNPLWEFDGCFNDE